MSHEATSGNRHDHVKRFAEISAAGAAATALALAVWRHNHPQLQQVRGSYEDRLTLLETHKLSAARRSVLNRVAGRIYVANIDDEDFIQRTALISDLDDTKHHINQALGYLTSYNHALVARFPGGSDLQPGYVVTEPIVFAVEERPELYPDLAAAVSAFRAQAS